jgi:hypothetical protein
MQESKMPTQLIQIDESRLAKITRLLSGGHGANDGAALCAMEAVAYVAREPWSDHPKCACPVISAFVRSWNDGLSDDDRTKILLPFIPRLVGTVGSKKLEARRATMAADWYVRTFTPAWLRLAGLDKHADTLAAFPEITSFSKIPSIRAALEAAQQDASAAWSAAWSAARSAAEKKLEPTLIELKASAIDLLNRMIEAKDAARSA